MERYGLDSGSTYTLILMQNMNKMIYLGLLFLLLGATHSQAQVTIGVDALPRTGAGLDLRTGNLGLLLPKVNLTGNPSVFVLSGDPTTAAGMMVYNQADVPNGKGLYVWNGERWNKICPGAPTISVAGQYSFGVNKNATQPTLSVSADGNGDAKLSYLWQSSLTGSDPWSPAYGTNTNASYSAQTTDAGTTYYRCRVTNACGTTVSGNYKVTVCSATVTDAEGNSYVAAAFGAAGCWMTQNLRSTRNNIYNDLTLNGNAGSNTSLKYYYYPEYKEATFTAHPEYGLFYTWAAATGRTGVSTNEGNKSDQTPYQGICPAEWHLPSDYEWTQLEEEIAKDAANVYSTTGATTWESSYFSDTGSRGAHGQKMKSARAVVGSTGGTSKSRDANGFDVLLVGSGMEGQQHMYGTGSFFWTSSSTDSDGARLRFVDASGTGVNVGPGYKYRPRSIRCKKDDN
jgi:uncharacterized protein (TIGR02145 family)